MNPLTLTLRNVRTYDDLTIEIPEGLLAIVGRNGSGKSTLINALDVALFGPESRTLADWYPRGNGQEPLTIELVFEHAGETYRVRRSYSPKGRGISKMDLDHLIECRTENGHGLNLSEAVSRIWEPLTIESQAATQDLLEQIIGLSRESFRASSFLAQGEAGVFCEAPPRARKQILSQIVGLHEWDRHLEHARQEKRANEVRLAETKAIIDRNETELTDGAGIADELALAQERETETRALLDAATARLATARDSLADTRRKVEGRAEAEKAVQRAEHDLSGLRARMMERTREIGSLTARLAARGDLAGVASRLPALEEEAETLRVARMEWAKRQELERDHERLSRESEDLRVRIEALYAKAEAVLAHVDHEQCDRCGQTLGAEAAARAERSYRDEASELSLQRNTIEEAELPMLNAAIGELPAEAPSEEARRANHEARSEALSAKLALAALDEAAERAEAAQREVEEMRAEIPGREQATADARSSLEELGPHDPQAVMIAQHELTLAENAHGGSRFALDTLLADIARYQERFERLAKITSETEAARTKFDYLCDELTLLAHLERACGPNGIPALILETIAIPQIETEATRILRLLGGPAHAVELHTLREKKTGGIADTLDIVLLTETGEAPYETFSGGERARIAFSLRLALAQLLASRKGSDTGLLVIDEIDGLDAQGIAALVSVLEDLQERVPRIIVVSHDAQLRDAFPQTLLLENVDGRSRIVQDVREEAIA